MKGEDIDKLFRDKLGHTVEPTTEQEWAAFEKSLDKRGGFFSPLLIGGLLLLLTGAFFGFYFFNLHSSELRYSKRSANTEVGNQESILPENQSASSTPVVSRTLGENDSIDNVSSVVTDGGNNAGTPDSESPTGRLDENDSVRGNDSATSIFHRDDSDVLNLPSKDTSVLAEASSSNTIAGSAAAHSSTNPSAEIDNGSEVSSGVLSTPKSSPSNAKDELSSDENNSEGLQTDDAFKENLAIAFAPSVQPSDGVNVNADSYGAPSKNVLTEMSETNAVSLTPMNRKDGGVGRDIEASKIQGETRDLPQLSRSFFQPFVYVKAEQNLILKTSIGVGLGVAHQFLKAESWMRNLSIGLGVGYLRSGNLKWEQQSKEVFYGFDRYQNEQLLLTQRLDLLQIPIDLNYSFGGVHSIFAGMESSFVINATQELSNRSALGDDTQTEKGYFFSSDTPEYIYFFQLGYGYALNERYQLQIGGSFSSQDWSPSNDVPLGVFFKLKLHIR